MKRSHVAWHFLWIMLDVQNMIWWYCYSSISFYILSDMFDPVRVYLGVVLFITQEWCNFNIAELSYSLSMDVSVPLKMDDAIYTYYFSQTEILFSLPSYTSHLGGRICCTRCCESSLIQRPRHSHSMCDQMIYCPLRTSKAPPALQFWNIHLWLQNSMWDDTPGPTSLPLLSP